VEEPRILRGRATHFAWKSHAFCVEEPRIKRFIFSLLNVAEEW
jgi:hypothetical protein